MNAKKLLLSLLVMWSSSLVAGSFTESAITMDDIAGAPTEINKEIVIRDGRKFTMHFDQAGIPRFHAVSMHGHISDHCVGEGDAQRFVSKTATLVVWVEKGPESFGSKVAGFDTLHWWLQDEKGASLWSYLVFEAAKATHVAPVFSKSSFHLTASAAKDATSAEKAFEIEISTVKN